MNGHFMFEIKHVTRWVTKLISVQDCDNICIDIGAQKPFCLTWRHVYRGIVMAKATAGVNHENAFSFIYILIAINC